MTSKQAPKSKKFFNKQSKPNNTPDQEQKIKFKTEICKNWELGTCKFGHKCSFAHGKEELKQRKVGKNYKTKQCKHFYEEGWCPYGLRCQFQHGGSPSSGVSTECNTPISSTRKNSLILSPCSSCDKSYWTWFEDPENNDTRVGPRLPVFVELEQGKRRLRL